MNMRLVLKFTAVFEKKYNSHFIKDIAYNLNIYKKFPKGLRKSQMFLPQIIIKSPYSEYQYYFKNKDYNENKDHYMAKFIKSYQYHN